MTNVPRPPTPAAPFDEAEARRAAAEACPFTPFAEGREYLRHDDWCQGHITASRTHHSALAASEARAAEAEKRAALYNADMMKVREQRDMERARADEAARRVGEAAGLLARLAEHPNAHFNVATLHPDRPTIAQEIATFQRLYDLSTLPAAPKRIRIVEPCNKGDSRLRAGEEFDLLEMDEEFDPPQPVIALYERDGHRWPDGYVVSKGTKWEPIPTSPGRGERPERCPSCKSPAANARRILPAVMSHERCIDPWHDTPPAPALGALRETLIERFTMMTPTEWFAGSRRSEAEGATDALDAYLKALLDARAKQGGA